MRRFGRNSFLNSPISQKLLVRSLAGFIRCMAERPPAETGTDARHHGYERCRQEMRSFVLLFLPKRSVGLPRPGEVKGAPFLGAAERTLDREDRGDRIDEGRKRPEV